MEPVQHFYGENINPVALAFLVLACLVTFISRPQNALRAFIVIALVVPLGQRFIVFGLHIHFIRLLILAGLFRVMARGELRQVQWNKLDKLFVALALTNVICGEIRNGHAEIFGVAYNALGSYFLVRSWLTDSDELVELLRFMAPLTLVVGLLMCVEARSHHNLFAVFGGVQELDSIRDSRARCTGPFLQPIMAGCFGATMFPLMAVLWHQSGGSRGRAFLGFVGAILMTVTSVSSGALMSFAAAVLGLFLWHWRERMQFFRRASVVVLILLAMVMKAPVWHIIERISNVVGGGGWHRAYLIDQFVGHFKQWAYIGTSYTANWAPAGEVMQFDPNNMDITNQYVAQGIRGGLIGFIIFIMILVECFKIVGRQVDSETIGEPDQKTAWVFGVSLAAHAAAFISVAYFDQTTLFLYWLFAVISCFAGQSFFAQEEETSPDDLEEEAGTDATLETRPMGESLGNRPSPQAGI